MDNRIQTLALLALNHLQCEENVLQKLSSAVHEMRETLLSRNTSLIEDFAARQTGLMTDLNTIAVSRNRLRNSIAQVFGIPQPQATVSVLSTKCDATMAKEIEERCRRLRFQATELNTMLIANGNLAFRLWELFDRVFRTLSGDQPATQVYERNGHRRAA